MWTEIILSLALVLTIVKLFLNSRDLAELDRAISQVGPEGKMPQALAFNNHYIQRIFSSITLILSKFKPSNYDISQEAISMGTLIANQVSRPNGVALALSKLLNEKIGSELIGVAVLINDSSKLKITQAVGLPLKRIGLIIESSSQRAFEAEQWGYQDTNTEDFSIFGIKRTLLVALQYQGRVEGVIWLGLASALLSTEKAEIVKKLAEYAAAAFQTAKMFGNEKEQQQKENDFLLGLSHDLRTPGNRALFCVRDLLYDSSLTKANREQLEIIELSINEQMSMINDVLDIAKHQEGLLISKPSVVSVLAELRELIIKFNSDLQRKNLLTELHCPEDLKVFIDPSHLRRILNNLMGNAVKFTNFGGIFIEVEAFQDFIEIVFKDTGCGVAGNGPSFEKFSKSQHAKTGYGLGLSLVKVLAEINNGEVLYYPSSFSGANLGVRLPVVDSLLRANC